MTNVLPQFFTGYKGNAIAPIIEVLDNTGAAVDISTVQEILFTLKADATSVPALLKRKTVSGGITFVGAGNGSDGKFQVNITDNDADSLSGFYVFEAEIIDAVGNTTTVATGRAQFGPAPNWTYTGDPSFSDKDGIRFLIGDTLIDDGFVYDEEILFAFQLRGSQYGAAATICRSLAAKFARDADSSSRDMRESYSQRSTAYKALAADYEAKAQAKFAVLPLAGLLRQFV